MKLTPRALVGAVLAIGVAGTLLTALATATTAPAAAAPAAPTVGQCHAMTWQEAAKSSDPDPAVDCSRSHTSRTYAVLSVPSTTRMTDLDALGRLVARRCDPVWERAVHPSIEQRLLSSYTRFWFAPTTAQIRDGARWVRCDLALAGGPTLAPLPAAQQPALGTAPHPRNEARCYLGKRSGYQVTVCSRSHQYRALSVFQGTGKRYPSDAARFRMAQRGCKPVAGRSWTTFNPTREQWRAGFRYFVCARKTTR